MTFGAYVVDVVFPLSDVDFFEVGRGQGFECGVAQRKEWCWTYGCEE